MSNLTPIDCLEFKRIALSEPNSKQHQFVEHAENCPDCLKYVGGVRKMDADLSESLNVNMPSELMAKIQLNQGLQESATQASSSFWSPPRAIAASLAAALLVGGVMFLNPFVTNEQIGQDYQRLLSAVMEHVEEVPATEVWGADRANRSVNAVLAAYDGTMQLEYMDNLQFGTICPMGEYNGLHATLDTSGGQVTFAYLKGDSVTAVQDMSMNGYMSRVKPIKGGNLIIISRNASGLNVADEQLTKAVYWDI